jgi:GntR family transcriptional regulator/MocR family aminotransferase
MDLHVTLSGRRDLAGQIYRALRAAILDGRLRRGAQVPPTRELAQRLDVSRNTVSAAYEWLTAEGLLAARTRAGSFVQGEAPAEGPRKGRGPVVRLRARGIWSALPDPGAPEPVLAHDFRVGIPDAALFPYEAWRRLMARQLRAASMPPAAYSDAAGHPGLRDAVARHVGVARGVRATAEDVLITQGAQQALDLIGRVLIEPGACVAVEEPGYPPARLLFQSLGARVVPVPVDAEGLDVSALPDDARIVYVTPSHQFPLGLPMSLARRTALMDWARRRDAVVIEDDYDSEFRFGGRPLETLHALDRSGRVIYVGSFSKVMLPALRLGFLIAPPSIQRELKLALYVSAWHTQWPAQGALARFIDEGLLARHIRKMRREYAHRQERILERLTRDFGDWLEPLPSVAGLHLSAAFRTGSRRLEQDVVARAKAAGVGVAALSQYYAGAPGLPGLVIGYGAVGTARVDEGLRRLRTCVAAAAGSKRG